MSKKQAKQWTAKILAHAPTPTFIPALVDAAAGAWLSGAQGLENGQRLLPTRPFHVRTRLALTRRRRGAALALARLDAHDQRVVRTPHFERRVTDDRRARRHFAAAAVGICNNTKYRHVQCSCWEFLSKLG